MTPSGSAHPPALFLDVDGVLNTRPGSLDGDKLDLIRSLISETGCLIVLSSSWRLIDRQFARICAELPIWRVTPEIGAWERADEVRAFLAANPTVQRFAILDDYTEGWGDLRPWLVICDPSKGLGLDESRLAAAKLMQERGQA